MDKESAFARFKQSIDYLNAKGKALKDQEIADLSGLKRPHVTAMQNGDHIRITKGNLIKFATAYSDFIDENWLLTGEGEMIRPDRSMRPHYDAKASAGFMDGISEGKMSAEFRAMAVPLRPYDFSIDVKGDSMLPRIEDGDVLMCRKLSDRLDPPIGKVCMLDTKDGWVVKVIKSINEETITLHSLNSAYRDYDIDLNTILGIAQVVGLVREF
ncbi:MAG: LexA family transcriptional regulator [Bacteroides sp.]|nr:LexA family transcriptional regulator [Bacteroides sp.]